MHNLKEERNVGLTKNEVGIRGKTIWHQKETPLNGLIDDCPEEFIKCKKEADTIKET